MYIKKIHKKMFKKNQTRLCQNLKQHRPGIRHRGTSQASHSHIVDDLQIRHFLLPLVAFRCGSLESPQALIHCGLISSPSTHTHTPHLPLHTHLISLYTHISSPSTHTPHLPL